MVTVYTLSGFANRRGLAFGTVRRYHSEGRLPDPDGEAIDGKGVSRPVWFEESIDDWQRPGQGARTDLKPKST